MVHSPHLLKGEEHPVSNDQFYLLTATNNNVDPALRSSSPRLLLKVLSSAQNKISVYSNEMFLTKRKCKPFLYFQLCISYQWEIFSNHKSYLYRDLYWTLIFFSKSPERTSDTFVFSFSFTNSYIIICYGIHSLWASFVFLLSAH